MSGRVIGDESGNQYDAKDYQVGETITLELWGTAGVSETTYVVRIDKDGKKHWEVETGKRIDKSI